MPYEIFPTKEFSADFNKLKDRKTQDSIKKKIEKVAENRLSEILYIVHNISPAFGGTVHILILEQ